MKILIAEDDVETAEFIQRGLEELGHNPAIAANGIDALHMLSTEQFDVAVIDRMLPGLDGLSVVRRARTADIELPVLLLTAMGRIEDRVDGLEAGADDYLVKPFAFSELAARVNALARRKPLQPEVTRLDRAGIQMDLLKRQVTRDGTPILLQPREFRLLEELMREDGKIVTRTMLLERVWSYHFDPQTNIVDTHISRLRSKLNEGGKADAIETIRGVGYRMAFDG
ncbi:MAG: two-component system, OmpR family, response regulator [Sphingomonadales bacterium]|nr:two-component system, OmpR family, response regulator [Sphingomonadales bacterium]